MWKYMENRPVGRQTQVEAVKGREHFQHTSPASNTHTYLWAWRGLTLHRNTGYASGHTDAWGTSWGVQRWGRTHCWTAGETRTELVRQELVGAPAHLGLIPKYPIAWAVQEWTKICPSFNCKFPSHLSLIPRLILFFLFVCLFWDRLSLHNLDYPGTHYIDQDVLKCTETHLFLPPKCWN